MSVSVAIVGRLRSAGFTEEQSQVVAEIVEEGIEASRAELATKADLEIKLKELEVSLMKEMNGMSNKLTAIIVSAVIANLLITVTVLMALLP